MQNEVFDKMKQHVIFCAKKHAQKYQNSEQTINYNNIVTHALFKAIKDFLENHNSKYKIFKKDVQIKWVHDPASRNKSISLWIPSQDQEFMIKSFDISRLYRGRDRENIPLIQPILSEQIITNLASQFLERIKETIGSDGLDYPPRTYDEMINILSQEELQEFQERFGFNTLRKQSNLNVTSIMDDDIILDNEDDSDNSDDDSDDDSDYDSDDPFDTIMDQKFDEITEWYYGTQTYRNIYHSIILEQIQEAERYQVFEDEVSDHLPDPFEAESNMYWDSNSIKVSKEDNYEFIDCQKSEINVIKCSFSHNDLIRLFTNFSIDIKIEPCNPIRFSGFMLAPIIEFDDNENAFKCLLEQNFIKNMPYNMVVSVHTHSSNSVDMEKWFSQGQFFKEYAIDGFSIKPFTKPLVRALEFPIKDPLKANIVSISLCIYIVDFKNGLN